MNKPMRSSVAVLAIVCASAGMAAETAATQAAPRTLVKLALGNPRAVAVDAAGTLYVADVDAGKIQKITLAGEVKALDTGGMAIIQAPIGLAIGADGTMAVADADNSVVFRVSPKGETKSMGPKDGDAAASAPTSVAIDASGNIFVANNSNATILKITPDGASTLFAGKPGATGSLDGTGTEARFQSPRGIAVDGKGNVYVADEGNSTIRKITPEGVVTTLAGKAGELGSKDGPGAAARFSSPHGVAASADGTLYVADTDNSCIRKITAGGDVSTLAGKAGASGKTDGPATDARFSGPRGIAVDAAGNVYVADSENGLVREISPTGEVRTVVGTGK